MTNNATEQSWSAACVHSEIKPAGFEGGHGHNPLDGLAVGAGDDRHAGEVIHPALGRKMQLAEVREARDYPGIVRREYVKAASALLEHHREHFFGALGQRVKSLCFGTGLACGLTREPFTNALVKTGAQHAQVRIVILNKVFCQAGKRFHTHIRDLRGIKLRGPLKTSASRTYALRRLNATAYRARIKADVSLGRNALAQRKRLLAPSVRKAHMRPEVRIFRRDMPALRMADKQIHALATC